MTHTPGDVILIDLGSSIGREQAGTRPAIFVSEEGGVSLIIPLSTNMARLQFKGTTLIEPDSSNKLNKSSVALVFQLRAVDLFRIAHRIGALSTKDKRALNRVLRSITLIK